MSKSHSPAVLPKLWLDWYFDAGKEPFKEAATSAAVKEKKNKIEKYVKDHVAKTHTSVSIAFEWSIADKIPLVYNLKATITKKKTVAKQTLKAAAVATRGIGTPQPPPQPPPPNL